MSPPDGVPEILAGRYRLERELGSGGMARVYLATDLRHDRAVAVKLLRPELTAILGVDRFLSEIRITARLDHPHILTLIDSGETDGRLWYASPYVRGESLRARIARQGRLPLAEALAIVRDVGQALAHAHARGVIHRDVKPENILLHEGEAMLADFGIALAVQESGGHRVTETGFAVGTPQYMSPEQTSAARVVDARSDIYSLGVVLYEMLTGKPPFTGPTPQAILARVLTGEPEPAGRIVDGLPDAVASALDLSLAREPDRRFATMEEMLAALAPEAVLDSPTMPWWLRPGLRAARRHAAVLLVALGAAAAGAGALIAWGGHGSGSSDLDPGLIAAFPFRITGLDSSQAYLGEGMVELIHSALPGDAGPRVARPGASIRAWRDAMGDDAPESIQVMARELGARLAISGGVVPAPGGLRVTASLMDVTDGRPLAQEVVIGASDSLPGLVETLLTRLLAGVAGVERAEMSSLDGVAFPGVRLYLEGMSRYRTGRWEEAYDLLRRAVDLDSTFALAALGQHLTAQWLGGQVPFSSGSAVIARHMDRLSPRDQVLARALLHVGGRLNLYATKADWLRYLRAATDTLRDRPEAWYLLGDHHAHVVPMDAADMDLAAANFRMARSVDSGFAPAREHDLELALVRGDSAEAYRLMRSGLARTGTGAFAYWTWRVSNDSTGLAALLAQADSMKDGAVLRHVQGNLINWLQDVSAVRPIWDATDRFVTSAGLRTRRAYYGASMLQALGRPAAAESALAEAPPFMRAVWRVQAALFLGGSQPAAAAAVPLLRERVGNGLPADNPDGWRHAACLLAQWEIATGTRPEREPWFAGLEALARDSSYHPARVAAEACLAEIEADRYRGRRDRGAIEALARFDSIMDLRPFFEGWLFDEEHFRHLRILAGLQEAAGQFDEALTTIRLRPSLLWSTSALEADRWREEGRLSALAGDRPGAIRAYRGYLHLRQGAERALQPEVNRIRTELGRLVAEEP